MELSMLSHKRHLFNGYKEELPLLKKRCLTSLKTLLGRCDTDRSTEHARVKTSWGHPWSPEACLNGGTKHLLDTESFIEQMSSWADTQYSVKEVLEHLKFRQATVDILLNESANKKLLEFHRNITEECGTEEKQHSWAVIEKQEEIIMYGPYYPNYNNGEHSEDIIIKQTQELLRSEAFSEGWKVYVFTMNSPCLARNTGPCMLNLVLKAQEWWSMYGVKTDIGYVKCWGFKGAKENLFREINYSQVGCMDQTEDYESYVQTAEKTDLNPLCEPLFSVVKQLLSSEKFPMKNIVQEQDWKGYFKSMSSISECKPEEEVKKICMQEANAVIKAAQVLLSEISGSFIEEYLERGHVFAFDYTFSSQVPDAMQDQMRLTFQQWWRETVQTKYAEAIREKLTEDFNQCTVQLFVKDIGKFTKEYLQIGRIQFPEAAPRVVDS